MQQNYPMTDDEEQRFKKALLAHVKHPYVVAPDGHPYGPYTDEADAEFYRDPDDTLVWMTNDEAEAQRAGIPSL
jgi:hypothetical protein